MMFNCLPLISLWFVMQTTISHCFQPFVSFFGTRFFPNIILDLFPQYYGDVIFQWNSTPRRLFSTLEAEFLYRQTSLFAVFLFAILHTGLVSEIYPPLLDNTWSFHMQNLLFGSPNFKLLPLAMSTCITLSYYFFCRCAPFGYLYFSEFSN